MFKILRNNRGEIDLGDKTEFTAAEVQALITKQVDTLVQPKIDSIVTSRLAQERNKYTDYDDLKKYKTEQEAKLQADEQTNLEAKGKFEEAMALHNTKLGELSGVISQKDNTINSMMIDNALTGQIVAQGGYLEESLALLKSSAELKDGVVVIKGKDANGLDQSFSVADGIKSFLEKKPHLVKASANAGGGNSGGGAGGGAEQAGNEGQGNDLTSLQETLQKQTYANDFTGMKETRAKIKAEMVNQGKTISTGVY